MITTWTLTAGGNFTTRGRPGREWAGSVLNQPHLSQTAGDGAHVNSI